MSTDELSSIELSELQVWEQWPKTHPAGRVCDHDGCATILSRYNAGATCEMHKPAPDFLCYHGKQFRQCACGAVIGPTSEVCRECADAERTAARLKRGNGARPPRRKPNAVQKAQQAAGRRASVTSPNHTMSMEVVE